MSMTITITWWMVALFLVAVPFVYSYFRKPGGQYDMGIDLMAITLPCWTAALTLCAVKVAKWIWG